MAASFITRSDNVGVASWDGTDHSTNPYNSGSAQGFIPEVWSAKLIENFYPATVFGDIANTTYEGEIKGHGDNIVIRTIPSITINDYEIGQKLTYERPASDSVDLSIDQAKYWAFQLNNVEKIQSDLDLMNAWSKDASEQMAAKIDESVLAYAYTEAAAANAGATAGAISGDIDLGADAAPEVPLSSTIIEHILNHGLVLDEQNCPSEGRWIVIPSWAAQRLKLSDLKDASVTGDSITPMRNGRLGMIDRFTVYVSNQIKTSGVGNDEFNIIAGHSKGLAFAAQITQMEELPNPDDFGSLVRGMTVFGRKVIDPTLITHGVWSKA